MVLIPYCLVICSILGKFATEVRTIDLKELPPKCLISHVQKNIFKLNTFFVFCLQIYILKHCIYASLQISCVLKTGSNSGPDSLQRDVIRWHGGQSTSY